MNRLFAILLLTATAFASDVPKISADLGSCRADLHVTDAAGKPVYNAAVHAYIKYGAFRLRKVELEVRTDSNGQASIVGLPERTKGPLTFTVNQESKSQDVSFDPEKECHARFEVKLQ